jgi:isochorismate synthase
MDFIFEKMKQHKKQNLPFVLFRKPNSKTIVGVFQENDHVYFSNQFQETGFVFAPFNDGNSIVFPLEFCEVSFGTFKLMGINTLNLLALNSNLSHQETFVKLVSKGVTTIKEKSLKKVVLSRTETIPFENFRTRKTFEKLLQQYPNTYCYCWFHPKIGLWMGATPEKLLQSKGNQFSTMSLAGTQLFVDTEEVIWKNKEIEEQKLVTDYIVDSLQNCATEISVSSPYTSKAGNLLHLKTDIEGYLKPDKSLFEVIQTLHPTPAVCGLPKKEARDFILAHEGYEREYYTGFLGELNYDYNKNEVVTDLYVNLRCMKINEYNAQLYIGCGITRDSDPESEWEETVNKSKTMKSILIAD